jgi:hypothetical protein
MQDKTVNHERKGFYKDQIIVNKNRVVNKLETLIT